MIEYRIIDKNFRAEEKGESYAFKLGSYAPTYDCSIVAVTAAVWAAYKVGDRPKSFHSCRRPISCTDREPSTAAGKDGVDHRSRGTLCGSRPYYACLSLNPHGMGFFGNIGSFTGLGSSYFVTSKIVAQEPQM
jgi:hypothetical protein